MHFSCSSNFLYKKLMFCISKWLVFFVYVWPFTFVIYSQFIVLRFKKIAFLDPSPFFSLLLSDLGRQPALAVLPSLAHQSTLCSHYFTNASSLITSLLLNAVGSPPDFRIFSSMFSSLTICDITLPVSLTSHAVLSHSPLQASLPCPFKH